jgi:hypothetical protein
MPLLQRGGVDGAIRAYQRQSRTPIAPRELTACRAGVLAGPRTGSPRPWRRSALRSDASIEAWYKPLPPPSLCDRRELCGWVVSMTRLSVPKGRHPSARRSRLSDGKRRHRFGWAQTPRIRTHPKASQFTRAPWPRPGRYSLRISSTLASSVFAARAASR